MFRYLGQFLASIIPHHIPNLSVVHMLLIQVKAIWFFQFWEHYCANCIKQKLLLM